VSSIRDASGHILAEQGPQVRRRPISLETARTLTGILEGVVAKGTGGKAAVPGYRVAGKTGTAQKIDPTTGAYSPTLFVGSFVGFLPADNPRLAIVAVLDEPRGEAWGGVVAAPVFRRIAEQAMPYLGVPAGETVKVALSLGTQ
jgi:cell division protein FtsI (penicillin-binding protein 3)